MVQGDGRPGGYRRPTNPAPVSGPGALSKRTDGTQPSMDLPDAKYGENAAYRAQEAASPMAASNPAVQGAQGFQPVDTSGLTPFGAETQRPDEPITAGMPEGPGAGGTDYQPQLGLDEAKQAQLRSYLPVLINLASRPDADPSTRALVVRLRAELG